jgi:hypothetical protein
MICSFGSAFDLGFQGSPELGFESSGNSKAEASQGRMTGWAISSQSGAPHLGEVEREMGCPENEKADREP